MDPKSITAMAALFLIVAGVALIAAQAIFPGHFQNMEKTFTMRNLRLKTNVVGFGVILLGVILLLTETGADFFGK